MRLFRQTASILSAILICSVRRWLRRLGPVPTGLTQGQTYICGVSAIGEYVTEALVTNPVPEPSRLTSLVLNLAEFGCYVGRRRLNRASAS
jgi:hypothetical protein